MGLGLTALVAPIASIIDKLIPDRDEANRIKADLEKAVLNSEASFAEAQSKVVVAEADGDKFQRSWRPLLMYMFMGLIVWYAIPVPLIAAIWNIELTQLSGLQSLPDQVWTLLTIGMGGYITGRSAEKVVKSVWNK